MHRFEGGRRQKHRASRSIRIDAARVWIATAVVASLGVLGSPSTSASEQSPAASKQPRFVAVIPARPGTTLFLARVNARHFGVATRVNVLWWNPQSYHLSIGIARHAIDNGLETPQQICRTTAGCVAAANADFFAVPPRGHFIPGDSVGGIIRNCVLLHTPETSHQQVDLDTGEVSQGLNWSATLDVDGTKVPVTAVNQELPLSYTRVNLAVSGTVLYTPAYAQPTASVPGRMTYVFEDLPGTRTPTRIGSTAHLELIAKGRRSLRVTRGHVDVSVALSSPLSALAIGDDVTMSTTSTAGCDTIGGHPILLDQGVALPIDPADSYLERPFARTALGWTSTGATVIVTVDGRDGESGATAQQLTALLESLHVVTAISLDGGYSTSLYAKGTTVDDPTGGRERPVATALLVMRG